MDLTIFRSYFTVLMFLIFIGIWVWAWSRSSKARFNQAANSLFDEKDEKMHSASLEEETDDVNKNAGNKL